MRFGKAKVSDSLVFAPRVLEQATRTMKYTLAIGCNDGADATYVTDTSRKDNGLLGRGGCFTQVER